jgi:hypothetical protein
MLGQLARLEAAFNEQIGSHVAVVAQFAAEEPAEKKVIEEIARRNDEEIEAKLRGREAALRDLQAQLTEEHEAKTQMLRVKHAEAEVQTDIAGDAVMRICQYTDSSAMPNNMVVAVLFDSPRLYPSRGRKGRTGRRPRRGMPWAVSRG